MRLAELQDILYAQDRWSVLLVFQAMDAAGKDGTIKHVMSGVNPQGCQVSSFKAPTSLDLDHDYLWRCIKELPERGRIGIFNRSYYEETLVGARASGVSRGQKAAGGMRDEKDLGRALSGHPRVRALPAPQWNNRAEVLSPRLERGAAEALSRALDLPEKNWKFSASDAKERGSWDDYMKAYEETIRETATRIRRGMWCRRTTSGSRAWSWPRR
jgi:polyphosphate kinase 2 (PPK2 family)